MSNTQPDTIDELIQFDRDTHDKDCGVTITRDLGNCDCDKSELKAALSAMVAEIIGEDVNAIERNSYAQITKYDEVAEHQNELRAEQRKRAIAKGFTMKGGE